MKKIKVGVLGSFRGFSLGLYFRLVDDAEMVALCDNNLDMLKHMKKVNSDLDNVAFYDNYDDFLKHDMDAVILANSAHQHAPFAIKALKAGKHVYSECLPVQCMKEAVELIETVESTKKIYAYGENFCYMPAPYEMRRLYKEGKLGEFTYGEGEYIGNYMKDWHLYTQGNKNHWRNSLEYATFYCTHSIGPLLHITGLRPISVIGIEGTKTEHERSIGKMGGAFGIELITLENNAIIKSVHGCFSKPSIWYSIYGDKGRMESAREDSKQNDAQRIYVNLDDGQTTSYIPTTEDSDKANKLGHYGSDFYAISNFIKKIQGNPDADIVDVYEALDMFLPGLFAYRSILNGGIPMQIPNLRDKSIREQYRNDVLCTDPNVAKEQVLPVFSKGDPEIDDAVYEAVKMKWLEHKNNNLS